MRCLLPTSVALRTSDNWSATPTGIQLGPWGSVARMGVVNKLSAPRKLLPYIAILFFLPLSSFATTFYVSQAGGAVSCGGDGMQTTQAYTWFNVVGHYAAGDTIKLCGTISGPNTAGTDVLDTQVAGSAGTPITLFFESNAIVQSPSCGTFSTNPTGGCVAILNDWWVVDGGGDHSVVGAGSGGGLIQSTLNGTAGGTCPGGTCSVQDNGAEIYISASNVTVKNINVNDAFDRPSCSSSAYPPVSGNVWNIAVVGGSNITIDHVTSHDSMAQIALVPSGTMNNITISNSKLFQASANIVGATAGTNSLTNLTIAGNDLGSNNNWWDPPDNDHINGMHIYNVGSGSATGWVVNGNYIHGDYGGNTCGGAGSHTTSQVFLECAGGSVSNPQVFNNVFVTGLNDDPSGGMLGVGGSACSGLLAVNNTFIGTTGTSAGECMQLTGTFTVKNNVCENVNYPVFANGSGQTQVTASDFNDYYNTGQWGRLGGTSYSLPAWQALNTAFDPHSISTNPNLNSSTFVPNTGSPVIQFGQNLTSLSIIALDLDKAGVARPGGTCTTQGTTTCWDIGAYQFAATSGVSLSTTSIAFGKISVGTTSGVHKVTLTNVGGTALTITGTPSLSGTDPGDFAITAETCVSRSPIAHAGTCSVSLTFSPTTTGVRTATLYIYDSDPTSPQTVSLTGTGK